MEKFEYKYRVPSELLPELRARMQPFVEFDSYMNMGGPSGYTVRSIYFDTPKFDYFHEKVDGIKMRKKIRIRGYNEYNPENIIFLEIKRKNERTISKNRAPLNYQYLSKLLKTGNVEKYILTDNGFKNALEDSKKFLFHIHRYMLHPIVLVMYERTLSDSL